MSYGPIKRSKPRVQVLRGWDPMNPATLTTTAAPGETIMSGQLVSKVWDTDHYEFVPGNAAGVVPYIAWSDSADMDVVESGTLIGLSCAGNFEIQTGYFDLLTAGGAAHIYNEGTPLTWAVTGTNSVDGNVRPALVAGEPIIGYVTRIQGPKSLVDEANAIWEDSSVTAANSKVIVFQTSFAGAVVPA